MTAGDMLIQAKSADVALLTIQAGEYKFSKCSHYVAENVAHTSKAKRTAMVYFTPPIHPGEMLREEFLIPFGITPSALAKRLNVQRSRIEQIAAEKQPITSDTALRLARFFGNSPEYWLSLQASYDLSRCMADHGSDIEKIKPLDEVTE